jgi:NAD+ kinase
MKGNYTVLKRMMLQAIIFRDGKKMKKLTALNDIVISRGEMSKIVRLSILINGSYVDTFPGDGVVVSTPTGSTGYSLSAGGPVVDHREKLIIITPICPHTMHARSFITSELSEVTIDVMEDESFPCILTSDGQKGFDLQGKDRVQISKSIHSVHVIRMNKNGFYETLRNKIYYRSK